MSKVTSDDVSSSAVSAVEPYYEQVYNLRMTQIASGFYQRSELTDMQMGLVYLDKCHHVSTSSNSTMKNEISYRVRICKTCCRENGHIELGTFVDQESAILINEAHEILNKRFDKLCLLRKEDEPYLGQLTARKYDRSRGRDGTPLLELLSEKNCQIDDLKRRKRGLSIDLLIEASYLNGGSEYEEGHSRGGSFDSYTSDDASKPFSMPTTPAVASATDGATTVGAADVSEVVESSTTVPTSMSLVSDAEAVTSSATAEPTVRWNLTGAGGISYLGTPEKLISPDDYRPLSIPLRSPLAEYFDEKKAPWDQNSRVRRTRGATFSYSPFVHPTATGGQDASIPPSEMSRIRTLTWLAGAGEDEVAAAQLLADLSQHTFSKFSNPISTATLPPMPLEKATTGTSSYDGDTWGGSTTLSGRKRSGSFDTAVVGSEWKGGHDYDQDYDEDEDDEEDEDEDGDMNAHDFNAANRRARSNSTPNIHYGNTFGSTNALGSVTVGAYTAEERQRRIEKFLMKRSRRVWTKKVKYSVRKNFADSRIRVKGRFIRKEDEELMKEVIPQAQQSSSSSSQAPEAKKHK